MRSCHCPSNPWGGLAKRAWLINELRASAGPENTLLLDSGDLFPPETSLEQEALLLKLISLMDYEAVAIGDQDLKSGYQGWSAINKKAGFWDTERDTSTFPWLSGGYRLTAGSHKKEMLVPPWKIIIRAGLRIGIVSVSSPKNWDLSRIPNELATTRPSDVIKKFHKSCQEPVDLFVVLSHQNPDEDRRLAEKCKGIDVIIGGHSQSLLSPPEVVNGATICQAGKNGENLGVLLLTHHEANTSAAATRGKESALPILPPEGAELQRIFSPVTIKTPRWCLAHQIIPLTSQIDECEAAASLISSYYVDSDAENAARLSGSDPLAASDSPQLTLTIPTTPVNLTDGLPHVVTMQVGNRGRAPLVLKQIRSRSPWLKVLYAPGLIASSAEAECRFEVSPEQIDRFFRCEFTVSSNDPMRPVVQGAFPGKHLGPMQQTLNIPALWTNLFTLLGSDSIGAHSFSEARGADQPRSPALVPGQIKRQTPLFIEFFYAPGCEECVEIDRDLLPALADEFKGKIIIRRHDVTLPVEYERLLNLQKKTGTTSATTLSVFVDEHTPLCGRDAIRKNLRGLIEEALQRKQP